jgi:cell wall-associated NlpC family hydrolase
VSDGGFLPAGLDRRLTPARPDLAAESLRGQVNAQRFVAPTPMRVRSEIADLRAAPSHETSLDTQALHGERVDVYEITMEGWAWGQLARDGYVGWLSADALAADAPATDAPAQINALRRVRAPRTFVYPARSMKTPPLMALPMNALVAAQDDDGAFARVEQGFVWSGHLAPADEAETDFVAVAESFEHAPYLWGGKTWLGLDCSGLIQIALHAAGVAAPRDTDMQAAALGAPTDVRDDLAGLRRGDLVFWRGHVGVMRDAQILLHANGHHMQVASEPLTQARARIASGGSFGAITTIRRL